MFALIVLYLDLHSLFAIFLTLRDHQIQATVSYFGVETGGLDVSLGHR